MRPTRILLFLVFMFSFLASPALAQEEIGFDEVVEETNTNAFPSWTDKVHLSGRFDLNLEILNPGKDGEQANRFRNYHKFAFLKVTPSDKISLDAEILGLSYYEIKAVLPMDFTFSAGKIWVPFGATPFHHYYGAAQGDPFTGLLLPNVWAEFGASVWKNWYNGEQVTFETDTYVIRGFDGPRGEVLNLATGGADDNFAIGSRAKIGLGTKIGLWGSVLYNTFDTMNEDGDNGQLLLWGGDILLDYGLLDFPLLKDLRFRGAFARAEIQDEILVKPKFNSEGWYYRYGDYGEVTYKGFKYVQTRVRYGTIIDYDDTVSNKDSHNWDLALLTRLGANISVLAEYQFNLEEVDEVNNDLFRAQLVFEF